MALADDFLADLADFDEVLASKESKEARRECILQRFSKLDKQNSFRVPDFDEGLDWLNVSEPLTFSSKESLRGKVVVLDFFTYCCVNCLHVLPDLHQLEQHHSVEEGLVVVGVHSAKFLNEKVTANILSAVLRYDITHPVVNDSETHLWQQMSIMCWPTFVIVGPQGQVLYYIVGEGHSDTLFEFVELALEYYQDQGQISSHSLPINLEKQRQREAALHFPGKVHIVSQLNQLAVADTGHHRILLLDRTTGVVQAVIGGKEKGFHDGSFEEARFSSPQSIASLGNVLFVADTENHVLRKVDLSTGFVTTLAGTGQQGDDKQGGELGIQQPLSTPWDVVVGTSPGGEKDTVVYIAMAGTHQIWAYCLKDVTFWKNKKYQAGTCVAVVGSGNEENRNNSYPDKASFAQPSGLAVGQDGIFVADSESSTVRMISMKDGSVKGLIGGDRDPRNLFAYGDKEGVGYDVRLQHPLAVSLMTTDGPLLVADSYNHKIKSVDIRKKECVTVIGTSTPGNTAGDLSTAQLNEPGGLCVEEGAQLVYIADTNNHSIKVLDWKSKTVTELPVVFGESKVDKGQTKLDVAALSQGEHLPEVSVRPGGQLTLDLKLQLAPTLHGNQEAPSGWKLTAADTSGQSILLSLPETCTKGTLSVNSQHSQQRLTSLQLPKDTSVSSLTLVVTCQVFVCHPDDTCTQQRRQFVQRVNVKADADLERIATLVMDVK
ncbi:hypothetical protein BaRGS_00022861 [Batillaria attramentaria]|uniref:Thioredoxin domain-containing protein n=1 Tax=Batillaria attramentaria TaxID=370345 RepID=A0ABD0KFP0_9CAEN